MRVVSSLLLVIAFGALTMCQSGQQLVVYSAYEQEQLQDYIDLFEQDHPEIEVKELRLSTGNLLTKLLAEQENPQADVVWGLAATSLAVFAEKGGLEPYAPRELDSVAARYRDPASPPRWVGTTGYVSALCVNKERRADLGLALPQDWPDLTDEGLQGHILMPDPTSSGTGYLTVNMLLQTMGDQAWSFLQRLDDNIDFYTSSGSQPCTFAGTGETVVGVSFGFRALKEIQSGRPIDVVFPSSSLGWDLEAGGLVAGRIDNRAAAETFLDWALSDSAMKAYAKNSVILSREGFELAEGFPADVVDRLAPIDFAKTAAERDSVLDQWRSRFETSS